VEKVSGEPFNNYMEKNIFKPAGMNYTAVWNENTEIKNETTGYDFDSLTGRFIQSGPGEHIFFSTEGDGGIYTSTNDYIKWFQALQAGKIFSKKIVSEARNIEFKINAAPKTGYGFGWFIDENGKNKKVYHSGDNGGFRTYTFTIPSKNYMIAIFANRSDINIEDIVQKIFQLQWPESTPFIKIEALTS
jgi:CubicO group peptidase (beta-lactamase class C family)